MNRVTVPHRDKESPLVSVIIPAYNAENFLAQAIQSVLDQTYSCYEIIIVDDGSTDKTKEILKEFSGKIRYIFQENRGPSVARNAGIKIAQGRYICFLDADDFWTPDKLEAQLDFLERHPSIALVFSDHQDFKGKDMEPRSYLEDKKEIFGEGLVTEVPIQNAFSMLIQGNFISTPTVMLKKTCLEQIGFFDENLWSVEDRDLWLRIAANFDIACLPGKFCKRRIHNSNISRKSELALRGRIIVIKKNRRYFPLLAPMAMWHGELARHYCQLGYVLLQRDLKKQALDAGLTSLAHAIQQVRQSRRSYPYSWRLGFTLIPAALLGWKTSQFIFRLFVGEETARVSSSRQHS